MSTSLSSGHSVGVNGVTVSFAERFAASEQFDAIFKEGMALVERTAAYLDGEGRKDAKRLKGQLTVTYATESMRLTTRLLELASWLLIRRALKVGDITQEEAVRKRRRVKLQAIGRPSHIKDWGELPAMLKSLIEQSFTLHDRIVAIDRGLGAGGDAQAPAPAANPVAAQHTQIAAAFRVVQGGRSGGCQ